VHDIQIPVDILSHFSKKCKGVGPSPPIITHQSESHHHTLLDLQEFFWLVIKGGHHQVLHTDLIEQKS
jgi:hypothetical protein